VLAARRAMVLMLLLLLVQLPAVVV
jgi:hypothetical protein